MISVDSLDRKDADAKSDEQKYKPTLGGLCYRLMDLRS
jgi:hypothetical protein